MRRSSGGVCAFHGPGHCAHMPRAHSDRHKPPERRKGLRVRRITTLSIAGIAACLLAGCALVQQAMPGVALSDSNVVAVLSSIGAGEVEAAKLARMKAMTSEIQAFAGRLLNE